MVVNLCTRNCFLEGEWYQLCHYPYLTPKLIRESICPVAFWQTGGWWINTKSLAGSNTAPEGNTYHKSQNLTLVDTPLLANLTVHSKWQNFELQSFIMMHKKGPQENATHITFFFFLCVCIFSCEAFLPPGREYGWTRLNRIQTNESYSAVPPSPSYGFFCYTIWQQEFLFYPSDSTLLRQHCCSQ